MTDILTLSVVELASRVHQGDLSAEEVAHATLAAIEKQNAALGAYITVTPEETLQTARGIDARRKRGEPLGPLAGVPIGIKDALCTRGVATTCASKILVSKNGQKWVSPYDATVIARLRAADALLPGKCNMDEFAMGSSTENSAFFPARNPIDTTRTPGGSSGGSAVSVAAHLTPGSLGSDTGGSIRQPAAYTGVVGFKPTYGRVSRYGLVAFASSLDQVGPFASDVRGAARILQVIAGRDPKDSTTIDAPVDNYETACAQNADAFRGLRVGIPNEYFGKGIAPEVEASIRRALQTLERAGAHLHPLSLPHTSYAVADYYIIATAEASSNLARFDGVRYGLREERPGADLTALYEDTRGAGFGREVTRRIMLGTYVLSAGYYDAYYLQALKVRTLIRNDFEKAFHEVDVIATPTAPTAAFKLGEQIEDPLTMYLNDTFTLPASLAGLPALSVPAFPTPATAERPSLPVGLQLIGPTLSEALLFKLGSAWEALRNSLSYYPF